MMLPKLFLLLAVVLIAAKFLFFNQTSINTLGVSTPSKSAYTIAIYGDSFVDTMGENLEYLQAALKKRYPATTFYYYNYGIGSQNVEQGIDRWNSSFDYKSRHFPPITQLHPDIIILGSFAYNPFYPYSRDRHWLGLQKLANMAKGTGAQVYMLAEIAPLRSDFGRGPHGVNYSSDKAAESARNIVEQIENAIYLSRDHLKLPLINAYQATAVDGKFGAKYYVDSNDGIHPSMAGHRLMAEMIASTIKLK